MAEAKRERSQRRRRQVSCWHCKGEMIWNSDVDLEDNNYYSMITFLECKDCGSEAEFWLPREKEESNV
jgi:transcription elongation factor Elf1